VRAALAAFFLALAAGLPLQAAAAAPREPVTLNILFTNDVHGYIEPCG
jgi:2',3'-cyclic-nucleotide 2'-phosphodiesterase (5'-nucleotidase family)